MPGQSTTITDTIRSTCQHVATAHQAHVQIDTAALSEWAAQLQASDITAIAKGLQLPVRFPDQQAEVTFLALYHLLDFGSGYDPLLRARGQREAHEMVQWGVLGCHLNYSELSAAWMAAFTASTAQNVFGVESYEDAAVPNLPGVTMSRPGPLAPMLQSFAKVVQEAGSALQEEGATSFGQAIIAVVDSLHKKQHPRPAAALVQDLVDAIPGFEDHGLYEGTRVVYARKAQALVLELYLHFHQSDSRFNFSDIAQLTGDSGALAAAVLRAKGVLRYSDELASMVDSGEELPQGPHERGIRAAAIVAQDALAAAVAGGVLPAQLGLYLLTSTEDGQALHGQLKPHITPGTTAY